MMLYVVRWKHAFFYYYDDDYDVSRQCRSRVVHAFATQKEAEEYKEALDHGRVPPPQGANPFIAFRALVWGRGVWYGVACDNDREPGPTIKGLGDLTDWPEPIFFDWIRDCGLEPPELKEVRARHSTKTFTIRDWAAWWEENVPNMTPEQKQKIWQALDKLEFYEIVTVDLEE